MIISTDSISSLDCDFHNFPLSSNEDQAALCTNANDWRDAIIANDYENFIRFEPPDAQENISYLLRDNKFDIKDIIFGHSNSYRSRLTISDLISIKFIRSSGIDTCFISTLEPIQLCIHWFKLGPYMWYIGTDHVEPDDIG